MARGTWKKGQSGNPAGRPKGKKSKWRLDLEQAIADAEQQTGLNLIARAVEMAYEDPRMMSAVLKKLLPDMKYVEAELNVSHDDWIAKLEKERDLLLGDKTDGN